ncbi:DUF1824 family protein [Thermoleptolyngbya sichuanensis A183]|uniref:DUF1824 family protein n=1 Tax=Thermoleptolyngbya sichuanensis A183 TaxID=2737172 RepID=A0A6M8BKZ9_9CYAN|nr:MULTISPECIES: DUF1824 family protein [Thermoleptolyngbya]MDG2614648.1 DUF1824 family protein [Thermoleptolyngbya sichuanensis XZ-Cy5]QKD84331.1 DUF1824 family protein [Thermoleptolyngbya sichuanensis A183]
MTDSKAIALTCDQAHRLLKQFDCQTAASVQSAEEKASLREALRLVAQHSDYQMLGVCASSQAEGWAALEQYAIALGYAPQPPAVSLEGPVYLKFNPKSSLCYVDTYPGEHRGVLVSCQSADPDDINDLYGHLPLDLWD